MSVLGVILSLLLFLASPIGMFCILLGFLSFFILPILSATTSFKKPTNFLLWLAAQPIRRAAVLISEADDALFKQMSYDSIGVEKITVDGDDKTFEDPDGALHRWLGIPFALADEAHGVLFDPRHAALGQRKFDLRQRGDDEYLATDDEYNEDGITKWVAGVFEMPENHEIVNLSRVRELVDGGERAEYATRVEELYKHSQDPFSDGSPMMKFLYPVLGWALPFFGIWVLASQMGTPTGSSGGSTVGWSVLTLLFIKGDIDWKRLGRVILGVSVFLVLPLLVLGVVAVFFGPLLAMGVAIGYGFGFLLLPILSFLFQPSATVSGAFSKLYFKLGFLGYHRPVFEWTPQRYELREHRDLDDPQDVSWYTLFGSEVGFTYQPGEDAWGAEVLNKDDVKGQRVAADGGVAKTNLPDGYYKLDGMRRDRYGAFLNCDIDDDSYYLHTGIALNRFSNSAVGEKSLRRLLEAKEKWGGETSVLNDKTVAYLTAGMAVLGIGMGVFFFLL